MCLNFLQEIELQAQSQATDIELCSTFVPVKYYLSLGTYNDCSNTESIEVRCLRPWT